VTQRPLILLATLVLVTGCTTTKEVGSRGDATLYQTKSWWPMVYPYSIAFEQVPIDRPGRHRFNVVGLTEAQMMGFRVCVASTEPLVDHTEERLNKSPLPSAGFKSCRIRLRISGPHGTNVHVKTLQCGAETWHVESRRHRNYEIRRSIGPSHPQIFEGEFTVSVEVLTPSKTEGDSLKIEAVGLPGVRSAKQLAELPTQPANTRYTLLLP
jgi:hypothetical protein